jgi:CheY-like chemotaxis protein
VSKRLLLVDDAPEIRLIAGMSLERVGGWTVVSVPDGEAALDMARSDGKFDAVLLDVMMPGLDGPTTLARLRAGGLPAEVPVVFLTAKTQASERRRLLSLGAVGVLAKPFDPLTLPGELEQLLTLASSPR